MLESSGVYIFLEGPFYRRVVMAYGQYNRVIRYICFAILLLLTISYLAVFRGCARKGLVTEKYSRDFYHVPKLLPGEMMDKNPRFIFYGDSRTGWRVQEKFLKKKNWYTWKMLLFPFYEIYWLGNGIVGGVNYLRHIPDYGVRERLMMRDAVYEEAKQRELDFVFHGGDMPTDGRRPSHWAAFLRENKIKLPLVLDFPFLPVVGNHEKANDPAYGLPNYEAIFDYPQFYVLDFPNAAIFVVDSDLILDQYQFIEDDEQDALFQEWFVSGEDSEQPAWLEREMSSRDQTFKILVIHHPPISFGKHHGNWAKPSYGRNLQQKRRQLLNLLYEQQVQIVLCSHEHLYEHSIIRYLDGEDAGSRDIHFVVSGGGGVPLRTQTSQEKLERYLDNYRTEGLDVALVKHEAFFHYCLVEITSDKVSVQVIEVTGKPEEPVRLAEEIVIAARVWEGEAPAEP
jgi:hypothetical protein